MPPRPSSRAPRRRTPRPPRSSSRRPAPPSPSSKFACSGNALSADRGRAQGPGPFSMPRRSRFSAGAWRFWRLRLIQGMCAFRSAHIPRIRRHLRTYPRILAAQTHICALFGAARSRHWHGVRPALAPGAAGHDGAGRGSERPGRQARRTMQHRTFTSRFFLRLHLCR